MSWQRKRNNDSSFSQYSCQPMDSDDQTAVNEIIIVL